MKQLLLTNWHFMRWLRLIIGIGILIHAVQTHDILLGMLAAFLLLQIILNTGCCSTNSCDLPTKK